MIFSNLQNFNKPACSINACLSTQNFDWNIQVNKKNYTGKHLYGCYGFLLKKQYNHIKELFKMP